MEWTSWKHDREYYVGYLGNAPPDTAPPPWTSGEIGGADWKTWKDRFPSASAALAKRFFVWKGPAAIDLYPRGFQEPLVARCKVGLRGVLPTKGHPSDAGFDVTAVGEVKRLGDVVFYGTDLQVAPPAGWYFDLVPRSSVTKTGYMLANSVGVIDAGYRGEVIVAFRKVDPDAPDLELPCRIAQLVLRPSPVVEMIAVTDLDTSTRAEGGFGSTGRA